MSSSAKTYAGLKLRIDGHTAVVELSNPPANTWTRDSLAALRDLVRDLDADRAVYALVIVGEGEKFFSAGADLKQFADGDKALAREAARRFGEAFETLSAFRGVSIAAINGYAMALIWTREDSAMKARRMYCLLAAALLSGPVMDRDRGADLGSSRCGNPLLGIPRSPRRVPAAGSGGGLDGQCIVGDLLDRARERGVASAVRGPSASRGLLAWLRRRGAEERAVMAGRGVVPGHHGRIRIVVWRRRTAIGHDVARSRAVIVRGGVFDRHATVPGSRPRPSRVCGPNGVRERPERTGTPVEILTLI